MKYIKGYIAFQESLSINSEDTQDVKLSKERLNLIEAQLSEYNTKKSTIDNIYKSGIDVDKKILDILGKDESKRNPFLLDYSHVAKMEYDLEKLTNKNLDDKIKLDDFQSEFNLAKSSDVKNSVNQKINEIKLRMSERIKEINDKSNERKEKEKKHIDKMKEIKDDLLSDIKTINTIK